MRMAVNQRGEIVDAVDKRGAVEIPDAAALAACGIDRIGLHEDSGARIAAGQARQRAVIHLLRTGIWIGIHEILIDEINRMRDQLSPGRVVKALSSTTTI